MTAESASQRAEIWQQYACVWDRQQSRYNQFRDYETQQKENKAFNSEEKEKDEVDATVDNYFHRTCFKDPLTGQEVRFTKPMVGYGGFVPRYPVLPRPQECYPNYGLISMSRQTYKLYPPCEYRQPEFAKNGPLSRTISTTPPFNPYNKTERLSLDSKKILWKRQNYVIKLANMNNKYK